MDISLWRILQNQPEITMSSVQYDVANYDIQAVVKRQRDSAEY